MRCQVTSLKNSIVYQPFQSCGCQSSLYWRHDLLVYSYSLCDHALSVRFRWITALSDHNRFVIQVRNTRISIKNTFRGRPCVLIFLFVLLCRHLITRLLELSSNRFLFCNLRLVNVCSRLRCYDVDTSKLKFSTCKMIDVSNWLYGRKYHKWAYDSKSLVENSI